MLYFCFDFLKHIASDEFAVGTATDCGTCDEGDERQIVVAEVYVHEEDRESLTTPPGTNLLPTNTHTRSDTHTTM